MNATIKNDVESWVANQLKTYPLANKDILTFIGKIALHSGKEHEEIIRSLFADGYCYYFALMLKDAFGGELKWHKFYSHIVFEDKAGVIYDIDGVFYEQSKNMIVPISEIDIEAKKINQLQSSGLESFKHRQIDHEEHEEEIER